MKNDNISRQAAIDAIQKGLQDWDGYAFEDYRRGLYKAQDILEALPSTDRWIPCSERLPITYGEYLITVQSYPNKRRVSTAGYFDIIKKGFGTFRSSGIWEKWDVIAWMPLPEPYKGERT